MPILDGKEQERQGLMETARLMAISARTAPKSGGRDDIFTAVIYGREVEDVAADMEKIGAERNDDLWGRQAREIRGAEVIVLIGVKGITRYVSNCGACGYGSCEDFEKAEKRRRQDFDGPNCIFKILDLGLAVGSAAKTASLLNADNRIFYRIGAVAKRLNYMSEASVILGIPLSARGKNPFFDRPSH